MFEISSKVNDKNPFARQFVKKDWDFPEEGQGTLLFESDVEDLNYYVDNIKKAYNEGIEIKIDTINLERLIHFKFKFNGKNQMGGTCWANAYAAAILLTNKRILGRKTETFETYRENLIKYACNKYSDGGNITNKRVIDYFKSQKLNIKELINEQDAIKAIMKGHFVVCSFRLYNKQWENFQFFFEKHGQEILTEEDINENMEKTKKDDDKEGGHSVLLIEKNSDHLKFLNSLHQWQLFFS